MLDNGAYALDPQEAMRLQFLRGRFLTLNGVDYPVIIDDGIDRYALDGVVGPVQVIGDLANNYFWAVQARAGDGVSGVINYVGEFDYALVKGG